MITQKARPSLGSGSLDRASSSALQSLSRASQNSGELPPLCQWVLQSPAGLLFHIYNPPCKDKTSPGEPTPSIKNETPKMGLDLVIEAIFPLD
jgi:hypothetical protein